MPCSGFVPEPESGGGISGCDSSFAPGRGLGGAGGGMGRVADGASGMSSGFCCAASAPASNPHSNPHTSNDSPSLNAVLSCLDIPEVPRSFLLLVARLFLALRFVRLRIRQFRAAFS